MNNEPTTLETFVTPEDAIAWMVEGLHDDDEYCIDGIRFAFKDDVDAVAKYNEIHESGCCGFYDTTVVVNGREALMGCNYGH